MAADKANDKQGIEGILVKVFVDLFDFASWGYGGSGSVIVRGYAAAPFLRLWVSGSRFRPQVKVLASPSPAGGSTSRREVLTRALVGCCGRSRVWAADKRQAWG